MENFQGDLTDIVRGSGGHVLPSPGPPAASQSCWESELQSHTPPPTDFLPDFSSTSQNNSFGDPFVNIGNPLLQELNVVAGASGYHAGDSINDSNNNSNSLVIPKVFEDDIKSQGNMIFPRIRISQSNIIHEASPCNSPVITTHKTAATVAVSSSPRGIISRSSPAPAGNDVINVNTTNSSSNSSCLVDNNNFSQIQISSPRNLGLKRRKSQAKKVVCIPAPAAANSRSSGEVVPSDLWAWRKYGQKPIKGSPYPRGYYRCSSSKGCSARKQVERSRADPNMLVITYTSEHNHPWPTQRNALAGSTRSSHPSKSTIPTPSSTSTSSRNTKQEAKSDEHPFAAGGDNNAGCAAAALDVKAEIEDHVHEEQQDMEFDHNHSNDIIDHDQSLSYRPEFHQSSEDFFADLDEIEGDPLTLLLSQGFGSGVGDGDFNGKTASDLFGNFFDWSSSAAVNNIINNNDNTASFDDRDSKSSL